jgi:hypothetical protein
MNPSRRPLRHGELQRGGAEIAHRDARPSSVADEIARLERRGRGDPAHQAMRRELLLVMAA